MKEVTSWLTLSTTFIVALFQGVSSQEVIAVNTVPSSMIVSQPENATNVALYCEVIRIGVGIRATIWRIRRPGDSTETLLEFNNADGTGLVGSENFFITDTTLRANLTIRIFDSSLNEANVTCGSGNDIATNGTFRLKIIGEFSLSYQYEREMDDCVICYSSP